MSNSKTSTSESQQPSERDRFWMDHNAAQASSGQTAKDYAAAQDLSLHAFYQARKRLRALGLLAPAATCRKTAGRPLKGKTVSFSKIAVAKAAPDPRFRLELPGGLALEWAGDDVPESVIALLGRLARPS